MLRLRSTKTETETLDKLSNSITTQIFGVKRSLYPSKEKQMFNIYSKSGQIIKEKEEFEEPSEDIIDQSKKNHKLLLLGRVEFISIF